MNATKINSRALVLESEGMHPAAALASAQNCGTTPAVRSFARRLQVAMEIRAGRSRPSATALLANRDGLGRFA